VPWERLRALPWTAPSTLARSAPPRRAGPPAARGLAGHRGGEGLVRLSSTCLPATATWQAYLLVAPTFAAAWISSNTWKGWETIDAWLEGTEMVVAFMRLANIC
jgi:hypothetical protein